MGGGVHLLSLSPHCFHFLDIICTNMCIHFYFMINKKVNLLKVRNVYYCLSKPEGSAKLCVIYRQLAALQVYHHHHHGHFQYMKTTMCHIATHTITATYTHTHTHTPVSYTHLTLPTTCGV